MHEMDRKPRGRAAKGLRRAPEEGQGKPVVAHPVLEEIAQDVERFSGARLTLDKREKCFVRCGPVLAEMQIRNEEIQIYLAPTTVIDSMTTAWRGTSRGKGPPAPVGVLAIFVTTSWPDTTLPNTA
jgi:hypothetical protein